MRQLQRRLVSLLETGGLDQRLVRSAGAAMRTALVSEEDPLVARSAGSAVEWLSKAVLFHHEPATLARAGRRYEASAAFLSGLGHDDIGSLTGVMTQNAPASIRTAFELLDPAAAPTLDQLDSALLIARNAATHLDFVSTGDGTRSLFFSLMFCKVLLPTFGLDLAGWIDDADVNEVALAVLQAGSSGRYDPRGLRNVALARVAVARASWRDLKTRLPASVLSQLAEAPEPHPDLDSADILVSCPTGEHMAWVEFDLERSDEQDSFNEDSVTYDLFMGFLYCKLCGLELDYSLLSDLGFGEPIGRRVVEGAFFEDYMN